MDYLKNHINTIGKILFVLLLLSLSIYGFLKEDGIESGKMYTVATVNRVRVNSNMGESVYYTYKVGDSLFFGKDNVYVNEYDFTLQNIIGERLMMKFEKSDPQNGRLIPNIRIGNKVKVPIMGWKSIIGGEEGRRVINNIK
ncbi:MAG: hypothetical protein B6I18_09495 [Bacteroidetes bacterium 4572_112]|nr:MAG: hypothetical protein B6I18_09495 [Bacteroidetes bacterium 4572_112]